MFLIHIILYTCNNLYPHLYPCLWPRAYGGGLCGVECLPAARGQARFRVEREVCCGVRDTLLGLWPAAPRTCVCVADGRRACALVGAAER